MFDTQAVDLTRDTLHEHAAVAEGIHWPDVEGDVDELRMVVNGLDALHGRVTHD